VIRHIGKLTFCFEKAIAGLKTLPGVFLFIQLVILSILIQAKAINLLILMVMDCLMLLLQDMKLW
jgi:hypothetical protein